MFQSYDVGQTGKLTGIQSLSMFLWVYFKSFDFGYVSEL